MLNPSNQIVLRLFFITASIVVFSCCEPDNKTTITATQTETNSNTTNITSNTTEVNTVAAVASAAADLIKEGLENRRRNDSIRNANEPRLWVYQIGDPYDDDDLAGKAYDKVKETENDVYIFKRNKKKYILVKGVGVATQKELEDSLTQIKTRISERISFVDLSKECRKLPINTDDIKYKIDREKKRAACKTCE